MVVDMVGSPDAGTVVRGLLDLVDRKVPTVDEAVSAVGAIGPLDDPDRYRVGANHGAATGIRVLRQLADEGCNGANEYLGRLAVVAEWMTWPLDD